MKCLACDGDPLQILRAALEYYSMGGLDTGVASAALEAAAKVEGLADDAVAMAHVFEAVLDHVDNRPEVADACAKDVLLAIDAYQRGDTT
jgi:hypothetical protein